MALTPALCEDLLIDILSLLPLADLCRCNGVSKNWRSRLVPSALSLRPMKLALLHLNFNAKPCIISNGRPLISFKNIASNSMFYKYLGVCNGMLLFRTEIRHSNRFFSNFHNKIENFLIYNPVSDRESAISLPPNHNYHGFHFLVFDQRLSYHHFMIVYWMMWGDGSQRVYLYSSKTSQWHDMGLLSELLPCKLNIDIYRTDTCCLNGIAYKIADYYDGVDYHQKNIIALEIEKGRLFFISSPTLPTTLSADRNGRQISIGEFGGCLGYACYDCASFSLTTWVLKGCGGAADEWVLRHKVNLQFDVADAPPLWPDRLVSLAFHPGNGEVLLVNFDSFLFKFNIKTKGLHHDAQLSMPTNENMHADGSYDLSHHSILYPFLWS